MNEDYPSEEDLKRIREWDTIKDPEGLLDFILPYWERNGWYKRSGKNLINLQLSTGGWSGNESIIEAMHTNMFFFFWWQKSIRGGHYWFKIKHVK